MLSPRLLLLLLCLAAVFIGVLAITLGSVQIPLAEIRAVILGDETGLSRTLLLELRLPRAINAFCTGALLSLAGALMQVLVRNPLADPYVLGISGGASLAALLAMLLGLGGIWISGGAFVGAMLAMALVFGLARGRGSWTPTRLLLTGVVMAAGWGALITFVLVISPTQNLRGQLFWLMGDLSYSGSPLYASVALALGLLASWPLARDLNVLNRGRILAGALGVDTRALQLTLYFLASLLTAVAVVTAGSVGFVGLVIPHLMRLLGFSDHRQLLPACALAGGSLLLLADTVARTVMAPQQLPVGIITALLGVPLFLYLLQRNNGRPT